MKKGIFFTLLLFSFIYRSSFAQKNSTPQTLNQLKSIQDSLSLNGGRLKVYNIFKAQILGLYAPNKNQQTQAKEFYRKSFLPYQKLWNDYVGDSASYMQYVYSKLLKDSAGIYMQRGIVLANQQIDQYIKQTTAALGKLSKHEARGVWYIAFGTGVTDLGGFGEGRMVVDLNHPKSSPDYIRFILPHEINHQIFDFTSKPDTSARGLYRCINEGFAVYMHQQITQNQIPLENYFQYTKDELRFCEQNEQLIFTKLTPYLLTSNPDHALALADRGQRIFKNGPGAIGYYIGYRICTDYIAQNGPDSWKDLYTLSVREIFEKTKFVQPKT